MRREAREYLALQRRLAVFKYAEAWGNVARACRAFAMSRAFYYKWKKAYDAEGEAGLVRKRPIARKHPRAIAKETMDKVLELRTKFHLGPQRIVWYMERYHGIRVAFSSVYRILVRHGVNRFPNRVGCRALHTRRYAKQFPGHHVQVDVKILSLATPDGKKTRRFQYTAIDDATRIRALRIYQRHNQTNAIRFIDYVLEKFPFRGTSRTGFADGNSATLVRQTLLGMRIIRGFIGVSSQPSTFIPQIWIQYRSARDRNTTSLSHHLSTANRQP